MNVLERAVRRVDGFQQTHRPIAFGFGVVKKFGDDRAGSLAALMAYGFLAIFPLLLLLTTVLGFAMERNNALKRSVLRSALRDFPIVGQQLGQAIHPLQGNALALAGGIVGLVWGSLGVTQAGQLAMAEIWNVPGVDRPPFVARLLRGLSLLGVLGVGLAATTVIAPLSALGGGVALTLAGVGLSVALNVGLFVLGFRVLTVRRVATGSLLPGDPGGNLLVVPPDARDLSRRSSAPSRLPGLRLLRVGARARVVAIPQRATHPLRGGGERRVDPSAMASEHRAAAAHRRR